MFESKGLKPVFHFKKSERLAAELEEVRYNLGLRFEG
jgi:hypothetical protein